MSRRRRCGYLLKFNTPQGLLLLCLMELQEILKKNLKTNIINGMSNTITKRKVKKTLQINKYHNNKKSLKYNLENPKPTIK